MKLELPVYLHKTIANQFQYGEINILFLIKNCLYCIERERESLKIKQKYVEKIDYLSYICLEHPITLMPVVTRERVKWQRKTFPSKSSLAAQWSWMIPLKHCWIKSNVLVANINPVYRSRAGGCFCTAVQQQRIHSRPRPRKGQRRSSFFLAWSNTAACLLQSHIHLWLMWYNLPSQLLCFCPVNKL